MTEAMVDDALVEKVAREIAREQMPSGIHRLNRRGYVERHWMLYRDHARAAIAIAYPAGVAAGREQGLEMAAKAVDAECNLRRSHYEAAKAAKLHKEARDFESMAIAHTQSRSAITAICQRGGE